MGTIDDCSDKISTIKIVELINSNSQLSSFPQNTWGPGCKFDLTDSALNDDEKVRLNELLNQYSDLFASHSYDLGRTHLASHHISLENPVPIKQPTYRVSHVNKPKIQQHIQDMLQHDIIHPSDSPWSSPINIIGKKVGGSRFVVNYRKLNSSTRKDSYPLPRIDDTLDCLGRASYFFSSGLLFRPFSDTSYRNFKTLYSLHNFRRII